MWSSLVAAVGYANFKNDEVHCKFKVNHPTCESAEIFHVGFSLNSWRFWWANTVVRKNNEMHWIRSWSECTKEIYGVTSAAMVWPNLLLEVKLQVLIFINN